MIILNLILCMSLIKLQSYHDNCQLVKKSLNIKIQHRLKLNKKSMYTKYTLYK